MTVRKSGNGRARAWILVKADSPKSAARQLYEELGYQGGDRFVLVRADVVDYEYNIVVPLDAENWDVLQEVYGQIQELTQAKAAAILPVVKHVPFPPHVAHGFVTEEEAAAGGIETEIGRLGDSPGHNAWG
jgi:hypothetical protein